jgi:hypothetical protein
VAQWRALRLKASSFSEHAIATLSQKAKKSNKAEPNPKEANKAKKKKRRAPSEYAVFLFCVSFKRPLEEAK